MKLKKTDLKQFLLFTEKLAREAGKILSVGFSKSKKVSYKGRIDPVTEYDLKSEKLIITDIVKKYPQHSILAEEGSCRENDSPFRWVIDPLDGTVNYMHRFPVYSVSIALEYNNRTIAGAVFAPEQNELYSAAESMGAFLNGKRIKVSSEIRLHRSLLATGFAYNLTTARKNNLGMFSKMMKHAQAVRRLGSAALDLCWLAAGRLDGFWEYYLHPWDTAAAMLIVKEAGGKVTKINGDKYSIFDNEILASNGYIHSSMIKVLTGKTIKKQKREKPL